MPNRPNIPPGPHSRKPNKNTNKVIVQANANDRATYNFTPAVLNPPPLGTTSRAYSLTHGSQQGLGINSSPLAAGLAGNNGLAKRGGSAPVIDPTGGYSPVEADLSKNPYGPAYDQLLSFIKGSADARGPEYDAVAAQLKSIRAKADEDLHSSYLDSRKTADASATALGVDPNAVASERDYTNRRMQENSDQALADNLAWLQKAKTLQGDNIQGYLTQAAQAKATGSATWNAQEQTRVADQNLANLQQLASLRRSGGGGGGKGGGGSSGNPKTTVTKTDTLANSGLDLEAYNNLMASGQKDAAAALLNQEYLNSGNPVIADTQKKINAASVASQYHPVGSRFTDLVKNLGARANSKKAEAQRRVLEQALKAMLPYSGVVGNPKTSTVVKTTGKGT